MTKGNYGKAVKLAAAILTASAVSALAVATASANQVVFNDRPATLPGNLASLGFECCQVSQFGGQVGFPVSTARRNPTVEVVMSSWACQQGGAEDNTCKKTSSAKFKEEVTLNIYEVGPGNSVGAKVGTQTRTFEMPYRPSASSKCTTGPGKGGWYDGPEATCYHGKLFPIVFKLTGADALPAPKNTFVLPESNAIISVAYNTSDYGANPQRPQPCNNEPQGCPYDSLNVAVTSPPAAPSVGTWPEKEEVFIASTYSALFCPPATASGNFEPSGKCWNEEQPLFKVKAS